MRKITNRWNTYWHRLLVLFLFMAFSSVSWGQINISTGTTVTENLDGIGTSATATTPANWRVDKKTTARTVGTYSAALTATERIGGDAMSSTAGNGIYNFGDGVAASATDRAIGGLSSSSASKSVNIYTYLTNNGLTLIKDFTLSIDIEKYRNGTNAAGFSIQMYYSTDGSTWTNAGSDFIVSFSADADNNGYTDAPGFTTSIISKTLNVSLLSGNSLYLAWNYSVTSGTTTSNSQALSIDNFSITANADATPPTLSSTSPTDNATDVEKNPILSMSFDEDIVKGTGNIVIKKVSDNSTVYSIDVTTASVAISNATATVTLPGNLDFTSEYYVLIDAGAFEDISGNTYGGISVTTDWNFTTLTPDITAPVWTGTYPKVSGIANTDFDLLVNLDEIGNAYYVVLANGSAVPSVAEVKGATAAGLVSSGNISVTTASTEFSGNISSLTPGTTYDVYVVAEDDETVPNTQATVAAIADVTTTNILAEPAAQATGLGVVLNNQTTMTLSWNDATVAQAPEGYLVLANTTGTFSDPVDGTVQADDLDLSDGTSIVNIAQGVGTKQWTNAVAGTTYYFVVYSYTNSGTAINYLLTAPPTTSASTPKLVLNALSASTYYAGDAVNLTWISANLTTLKVEMYIPSSTEWSQVTTTIAADGNETISIATDAAYATTYKMRISDATNAAVVDSSATFTVKAVASTLADLIAMPANSIAKYTGKATVTYTRTAQNQKYIQDETAAVLIYDNTTAPGYITDTYAIGEGISNVEGKVTLYNGLIELVPQATTGEKVTGNPVITPEVRTIASLTHNDQCKLVKLVNVAFDQAGAQYVISNNFVYNKNYDFTGYPVASFAFRTAFSESDYLTTAIPITPVTAVVLVGQYNTTMQVTSRNLADFQSAESTVSSSVYTVGASDITAVPYDATLAVFESNLTVATGAVFETYEANGTTVATDLATGYIVKVTAEDGLTQQTYTVTKNAALTGKDFLSYSFGTSVGVLTDPAIAVTVPYTADVTNLTAIFTLSSGATAKIGTDLQESGVTANNFTSPVVYTVTAEDGNTKDWTVTVTKQATPSSEKDMLTFSVLGVNATVTNGDHTVTATLPYGTDRSALVATFTLSPAATAKVGATDQESGVTANDFTNPVTYTVTAEDATTQDWVVTITNAAPSADAVVSSSVYTVGATDITNVPFGETLATFKTNITPAADATFEVYQSNGTDVAVDLTTGYKVITTAQDGTTHKTYTITINAAPLGDLFFSEYIEGSSSNKAVEIYNGTGTSINLANYKVETFANGSATATYSLPLSGSLANGEVYIIANASANATILAQADVTATITYFNGDDAVGLFNGTTLIDVIGVIGTDPGTAWDVAGTTAGTVEHTLVRKATITEGNTDWTTSAGTNSDDSEWIVYAQDETTYLGSHTSGDFVAPVVTFVPANGATTVAESTNVTLSFDEDVFNAADGSVVANGDLAAKISFFETATPANTVAFTATISGKVVTVDPTAYLKLGMQYTVSLLANKVEDADGNENAESNASFTVRPASTDATVTSTEYSVDNAGNTISGVSFSTTLIGFKSLIVPALGASFEVFLADESTVATDLQNGYKLICTAEDDVTTKTYTINKNASVNTETNVLTYSFTAQTGAAAINGTNHTVAIEVAYGTNVANLVAGFTLSTGATAKVGTDIQVSAVTANNFTNPVVYTITAEDATTTQDWTVTVTVKAPNTDATLSDLKVEGATVTGFVASTLEYTVNYPYGTITVPAVAFALNDVTATAVQTDATVIPGATTVEVTAQDGTTKITYTVNFAWDAASTEAYVTSTVYTVDGTAGTITNVPYNASLSAFKSNLTPAGFATFEVYESDSTTVAATLASGQKVIVTAQDGVTTKVYTITLKDAPASDLFFSEYIEGSGNNKALEIFNPTLNDVDLSDYVIRINGNGSAWSSKFEFPAGTILASNDVYVIAHAAASATILAVTDSIVADPYAGGTSYVVVFNGDDVRGLFKVNGTDTTLIDLIGAYDMVDPGAGWSVAGITSATANHTLVRKSTVISGNSDWTGSAGTSTDDSEWSVLAQDDFSNIGSHSLAVVDETAPVVVFNPENGATGVLITSMVTLTFDENVYKAADGSSFTANEDVASLIEFYETATPLNTVAFTATISGKVITIVPSANLTNNLQYSVVLKANSVEDLSGNEAALAQASFTTIDANAPVVELIAPIGGETYYAGDNVNITWTSANITNVKIEAYVPSNAAWDELVASTDATDGNETITIPADAAYATTYKIRISDATNNAVVDSSAGFTIIAVATDIAQLRAMPNGAVAKLTGKAVVTFTQSSRNQKFIQDASGAILIDDSGAKITTAYVQGDEMTGLEGSLTEYGGMKEFVPTKDPGAPTATSITITPQVISLDEFAADFESFESELVTFEEVKFVEADGTVAFTTGKSFGLSDGTNTANFYTNFYQADYIGAVVPVTRGVITGIANSRTTGNYITSRNATELVFPSNNAKLSDLSVDGTTITGFSTDVFVYTVELASSITVVPTVTATAAHANALVEVVPATTIPGITKVNVLAQDAETMLTYEVRFTYENLSNDATLSDLKVDDVTIVDFDSATMEYTVVLNYGSTIIPTVSGTANQSTAIVVATQAASLPGDATIQVTAEDKVTELVYTVHFKVAPNTDATLSSLMLDGVALEGFVPAITSYVVGLTNPAVIPVVSAEANDSKATLVYVQASVVPGMATVEVTAEDGITKLIYKVTFVDESLGHDATLSDLKLDGTTIANFDKAILEYNVELAYGTTTAPVVEATATDANADVVTVQATVLPGDATITVKAEDGGNILVYIVHFTIAANTDATLSDLTVDGVTVAGFNQNTFQYLVELPYGNVNVPVLNGVATDSNATINIIQAGILPSYDTVIVTAEDGITQLTYVVQFAISANTDATLSDLKVGGTTVTGFSASVFEYSIELPYNTTSAPEVGATATDVNADVTITQATNLPGDATVSVVAEDGETTLSYSVHFTLGAQTVFTVTFHITDNSSALVEGATVDFNGANVNTNAQGDAVFANVAPIADAPFTVTKGVNVYEAYSSTLTVSNSDITVDVVLILVGVTDQNSLVSSLYPNPTNGKVYLTLNPVVESAQITITDLGGKVILSQEWLPIESTIDLSGNKQGVYFIKITSGNSTFTGRIVLN